MTDYLIPAALIASRGFAARIAPAAGIFLSRTSDVDGEITPVKGGAVEGVDGLLGFLSRRHGDESEAARPAAHPVGNEIGFRDGAVRGKGVLEIVFSGVEGKISYKQFRIHSVILLFEPDPDFQCVPDRRVSNHH
jgi:hypothetical protein